MVDDYRNGRNLCRGGSSGMALPVWGCIFVPDSDGI